jgi:outer membrane protein OmpA-like peptidoglycan-associated protein
LGQGANSIKGGAGGGGGYYGGSAYSNYGGGAGSSWVTPDAYNIQYVGLTGTGDGRVIIRYSIDTNAPTVTGISSPLPSGTYREGTEIFIDVNFSEPVFVDGAPTLDVNAGTRNPVTLTYLSGSGTSALRFRYSILSGDDTSALLRAALDVSGTDAFKLNGSSVTDPAGNVAIVTLPSPGSPNSLAGRKTLVIDGAKPLPPQLVDVDGASKIDLEWTRNTEPDLKEYRIYVSTDQVNYTQLGTAVTPATTFSQLVVATGIVYYYYVTAIDVNGNESNPSEVVSWFIPTPGAISVPSMVVPSPTNDTSPEINGVADPNVTVLIYRNETGSEVLVGSTTTGANGRYSFTIPGPLAQGSYSISARASSSALVSSRTTIRPLIVDLAKPEITSIMRLNPSTQQTAASSLVWRVTFTEEMKNLTPSDFVLSQSTAQVTTITRNQFNSLQWDVAVSGGNLGSATGPITLGLIANSGVTDLAGNNLLSTTPTGVNQNYVIDRSNPTPVITAARPSLGGSNPTTSITISMDFPVSSSFTIDDLTVAGGTLSQFTGGGLTFSAVLTATAGFEGLGRISIRAGAFTSEAGNTNRASPDFTMPIDMVSPTVLSVDRLVLNGAYGVGASVDIVVNFSERIRLTGSPRLLLETGTVDRFAEFVSATQSNAVFRYVVQAGDNSLDLNYHSVSALVLNGGAVSDLVGNAADVLLPGLSSPDSLASKAALVIDTIAPTAPGLPTLTIAGGKLVTNFVNSTNTNITAQVAVTAADYTLGGRAELLANGVVVASTSTMVSPISIALGTSTAQALQALIPSGSVSFAIRVFDGAGNSATSSVALRTVDFVAPRATISSSVPSPIGSSAFDVRFWWSETVSGFNCAVNTTYTLISGNNCVQSGDTYSRTVTPTQNTEGVIRVEMVASNVSTGVYDAAGNPALAAAPLSLILDSKPPAVLRVEKITPDGTYGIGSNIDFRLVFNEPVVLSNFDSNSPSLTLNAKSGAKAFVLSTTSDSLVFRYKVQAGDSTADLNYVATTALNLGSFQIRDAGNNNAVLTLPDPALSTSLGGGANYILDGVAPDPATISSITATGGNVVAGYVNGTNSNIEVILNFTKSQALGGRVDLKVGSTVVLTVLVSDASSVPMTLDLGTTTPAQLKQIIPAGTVSFSAVLYDSVGNFASSTEVSLSADFTAPVLTGSMTPARTLGSGDVATLLVSSSESVLYRGSASCGSALFNLLGGTISCAVWPESSTAGVSVVQLSFSPSVQGAWSVTFPQGALADRAGNPSVTLSLNGTADTVQPRVLSVRALSANATYKVGQRISINVNFDEIVNVTNPVSLSLTVASGVTRAIGYTSGTGTATLRFDYVVQAGDSTADLDFSGASALSGVIRDQANNQADLDLSSVATLASAAQLVVDGAQPAQPIGSPIYRGIAAGVDQGQLLNSLSTNLIASISLSPQTNIAMAELLLDGVVIARDTDVENQSNATFDLGASSNATMQQLISTSARLKVRTVSVGGNVSADSAETQVSPDYIGPSVSISASSQTLSSLVGSTQLTFVLSESSSNFDAGDVVVLGGTLSSFARSGSTYTATFTPAGDGDWSARIVAGAFTDATANPSNGSNILRGSSDLSSPSIAALTYQSPAGSYRAGQTLLVEVRFSETVIVTGTPLLPLLAGAGCAEVNANYLSGSGTTRLVFLRTVVNGESCQNAVESGTVLVLNGGSIQDAVGNPAALSFTPQLSIGRNINAVTPAAPLAPVINTNITSSTVVVDDTASTMNVVVDFGGSRAYSGEVKLFIGQTLFATTSFAVNAASVTFNLAATSQLELQGILEPLIPALGSQPVRAEVSDTNGNFATSPITTLTALWSATYAQKASAQATITSFTSAPFPTPESYKIAGVSGVSDENVDLLNQVLAGLPSSARDIFPAELDAIVAVLNSIKAVADDTNGSYTPVSAADLALLCAPSASTALCTISSAAELALFNSILANGTFAGANSLIELERIAQFSKNVIAGVQPSASDFAAMGFASVTAADMALIWPQILASAGGAPGRDSFAEIANLIELALAKKTALAELAYFDAASSSAPTLQTYLVAGIDGVNSANINMLNALLRDLGPAETSTPEQLQALVALANRLLDLADGSKDGESRLSANDASTLGLGGVGSNPATLSLLNSAIDGKNPSEVDSSSERKAIADIVAEIARLAALNPSGSNAPASSLTEADLNLIGITFSAPVTLADVLYAIAASANDLSGITDLDALNAAITAGVKARGELEAVGSLLAYSSSDTVSPTAASYAAAGITGVTANNLALINDLIGSGLANPTNAAELQALVDAVNKLLAGADGILNDGSNLTAADFALLGLGSLNTSLEVAIANGLLDGKTANQVSSSAALSAMAVAVSKLAATADATSSQNAPSGPGALTVNDLLALGITGVTQDSLAAVIAAIIADPGSTDLANSKVTSLEDLQQLVNAAIARRVLDLAAATIAAFDGSGTAPSVADYRNAGVIGVSAANLELMNSFVGPLAADATDTNAELQALADSLTKLQTAANQNDDNSSALTAADLATLGVTATMSPGLLALVNNGVDVAILSDIDSPAELSSLVALGQALFTSAATGNVATLTVDDFARLGLTSVTEDNLAAVLALVRTSGADGSGLDSLEKINALISAANNVAVAQAAIAKISQYTGGTAPAVSDYLSAGVTSFSPSLVGTVNSFMLNLSVTQSQTLAQIQAASDSVNKLYALSDATPGTGVNLASQDLTALGFSVSSSIELALLNSILDRLPFSAVDSHQELAEIITKVRKAIAAADSGTALTIQDFLALGFANVTAEATTFLNQRIAGTANNGSGVDSFQELEALVLLALADAKQAESLAAITDFNGSNQAPILADYLDSLITGVTSANLAIINSFFAGVSPAASDTAQEIQAVVDAVNALAAGADTVDNGSSSIDNDDLKALGIQTVSAEVLALVNDRMDVLSFASVDSAAKLQELILIAKEIISLTEAQSSASPTVADFELMGITGVTAANQGFVNQLLAGRSAAELTTVSSLQSFINTAVADFNKLSALQEITNFDGSNTVPSRDTYLTAQIANVTDGNLSMVNSFVSQRSVNETNTAAKIQALVDAVNKIRSGINPSLLSQGSLTRAELEVLDLTIGSNPNALQLMNSIMSGLAVEQMNTFSELDEIAEIVEAIMQIAAGQAPRKTLTAADLAQIGLTGVTSGNLNAVLSKISQSQSDGSGANLVAKLQQLVVAASNPTAAAVAQTVIEQFDGSNQTPTTADYQATGVFGVSDDNLALVNAIVGPALVVETNTFAKVQAIVDALSKLSGLVDGVAGTGFSLTAADLTTLGLETIGLDSAELRLLNSALDRMFPSQADSAAEIQAAINAAVKVMVIASGGDPVNSLTVEDFAALGVSGVTADNLLMIRLKIQQTAVDGSGADSHAELSALVEAVNIEIAAASSLPLIVNFVENRQGSAPAAIDYSLAGVEIGSEGTVGILNQVLSFRTGIEVDTRTKLQTLVSSIASSHDAITSFAAGSGPASTLIHFQTLGITGLTAQNLAAMNALLVGLDPSDLATLEAIQALADTVAALSLATPSAPAGPSTGSPGGVTTPGGLAPTEVGEVAIVETATGLVIGFEAGSQVKTVLIRLIDSSGKVRQVSVSATALTATLLEIERGRTYQVEITPITATGSVGVVYKTTFASKPNPASDVDIQRDADGRVGISWSAPKGFIASYKILVQQNGKVIQEIVTSKRSALLAPFAGLASVSVFAMGEGGTEAVSAVAVVSPKTVIGAVTARHATRANQSLISFNAESSGNPTYKVYVNGKLVCSTKNTSCTIKQRVGALDKLRVISSDGAVSPETNYFEIMKFAGELSFKPNTVAPASGFTAALNKIVSEIKRNKFTRVVVTGHANQTGPVPTAFDAKLARERAEYVAKLLRVLLPGVTVVSVERGGASPLVPRNSVQNIRAEIYASK